MNDNTQKENIHKKYDEFKEFSPITPIVTEEEIKEFNKLGPEYVHIDTGQPEYKKNYYLLPLSILIYEVLLFFFHLDRKQLFKYMGIFSAMLAIFYLVKLYKLHNKTFIYAWVGKYKFFYTKTISNESNFFIFIKYSKKFKYFLYLFLYLFIQSEINQTFINNLWL